MSERRHALLIASTTFADGRLRKLSSPSRDVARLAEVLADPAFGDYAVETCEDKESRDVRHALELFFRARQADDLVLLYVSTHGVKDESGNLFFAAADTSLDAINSTTCEASFIHRLSRLCKARRQIFILDACFSGAFGKDWGPKSSAVVQREDVVGEIDPALAQSHVRGLVVFAASTSYQYSFEGSDVIGSGEPSVFTKHLIHGLRSGEADLDGDGRITDDELYRYVADATRSEQPAQTPQRWVIGASGELVLARSSTVRATPLPVELLQLFDHPLAHARLAAVGSLADIASGGNRGLALSAVEQLRLFAEDDDSNRVRLAARQALASTDARAPVPEPSQVPSDSLQPVAAPAPPLVPAPAPIASMPTPSAPSKPMLRPVHLSAPEARRIEPAPVPTSVSSPNAVPASEPLPPARTPRPMTAPALAAKQQPQWLAPPPAPQIVARPTEDRKRPDQLTLNAAAGSVWEQLFLPAAAVAGSIAVIIGLGIAHFGPAKPTPSRGNEGTEAAISPSTVAPLASAAIALPEMAQVPLPDASQVASVLPVAASVPSAPSRPAAPVEEKTNTLTPTAIQKLDDLVSKIKGINLEVVIAVGHTDSIGSDAYNQKLSVRRAEAIKTALIARGVDANRIYTEGKGEKQPVADNATPNGRAKNNRVEIEVVGTRMGAASGSAEKVTYAADAFFPSVMVAPDR